MAPKANTKHTKIVQAIPNPAVILLSVQVSKTAKKYFTFVSSSSSALSVRSTTSVSMDLRFV